MDNVTPPFNTGERQRIVADRGDDKDVIMTDRSAFPVADAAKRFEDADRRYQDAASAPEQAQIRRQVYQAIADACKAYGEPRNHQRTKPEPFPAGIAMALFVFFGDALSRNREASFEALFEGGARAPGTHVLARIDMERACRYVQAAKAKIIEDSTPIKTISVWFAIGRRTVHDWVRTVGANDLLGDFFPDAGNRGELIISTAKKAGRRYSVAGRGQAAIASRAAKRRKV